MYKKSENLLKLEKMSKEDSLALQSEVLSSITKVQQMVKDDCNKEDVNNELESLVNLIHIKCGTK